VERVQRHINTFIGDQITDKQTNEVAFYGLLTAKFSSHFEVGSESVRVDAIIPTSGMSPCLILAQSLNIVIASTEHSSIPLENNPLHGCSETTLNGRRGRSA